MIVKLIESEQSLSGKKLQFKNPLGNFISATNNTDGLLFDKDFTKQLDKDKDAIQHYIDAFNQTGNVQNSFDMYMAGASAGAQSFSKDIEIVNGQIENAGAIITKYEKSANMAQVTNLALNKSFDNCQKIINEYNSGCKNTNLSQKDFVSAVSSSNSVMGNYLSNLQGRQATMKDYIKALVGAKAGTVALSVASTALNMALSMGIAAAVQLVISGISKLINYYDDLSDKVSDVKTSYDDAQNTIHSHAQTIEDVSAKYQQLAPGVDALGNNISLTTGEFEEYNSICNQIAEMYPSLVQGWTEEGNAILKLKGNVEALTEAYNQEQIAANNALIAESKDIIKDSNHKAQELGKIFEGANGSRPTADLNTLEYNFLSGAYSSDNVESYISQQNVDDVQKFAANLKAYFDENLKDYFKDNEDANLEDWYRIDMESGIIIDEKKLSKILTDNKTLILSQLDTFEAEMEEAISGKKNLAGAYFSNQVLKADEEKTAASKLSEEMQSVVSSIISNMDYDTASQLKSYNDIQNYVNNIVESLSSLSSGESGEITTFLDLQTKYNGNDCTVAEYNNAIDAALNAISGLDKDVQDEIKVAIGLDDSDFQDEYNKVAKNLNLDNNKELKQWIDSLDKSGLEIVAELSADTNSATWSIEQWKDRVDDELAIDATLNFDISAAEQSFSDLQKAIRDSLSSEYGTSSENRSLISSLFGSLDEFDSSELFDKTSTGIKLNIDELNRLQKEQAKIQRQKFDDSLSSLYDEYRDLTTKIQNCADKTGDEYNQLVESRNATVDKINTISELQAEYDGLTSAYARWQAALANGEEGDMYDNIRSEFESAKELYEQGLLGTSEFESYMEMLTGRDLSTASYEEMEQAWRNLDKSIKGTGYSIKDFLSEGSIGVESFLKAASKIPDTGITEKNGIFNIDVDDLSKLAEQLGVGEDLIVALLQKARDYRLDIDFTDSNEQFDKIVTKAQEASEELRNLGLTEMKFDFTTTDENSLDKQLKEIERLYNGLARDQNGKIDLSVDGAAEVATVYQTLLEQKQKLNSPIIMDVDVSKIDDAALSEDIGEIQKIISKQAEIEVQAKLGNDTTQLQSELQELINSASDSGNQILFGLDIDESTSFSEIQEKINEWCKDPENAQIMLDAGIDESRLTSEADKVKQYIQNALNGIQVDLQFNNKILDNLFGGTITVNADTDEANDKLDETKAKEESIAEGADAKVSAETSSANGKLDVVNGLLGLINTPITASVGANTSSGTSKLNAFETKKKEAGAPVTATVKANTSTASSAINGILSSLRTIAGKTWSTTVNVMNKVSSGINNVVSKAKATLGINNVRGTANVSGNWGAKRTETALMGEIAPELWVHSDTGTWELVENPQFRKVRKGDIIFNGDQTDELMRQGAIDAFGHSFLSGTAYKTGATGSGSIPHKTGSSGSGSKKSSSSSKKSSSSSAKEEAEETLETIDWIEIAIDRIERAIDSLDLKASSVYKTWSTRNSALKNQISEIAEEIDLQSRGYNRYIQEANSVGLSSSLANRVKDGTIDINEYDSETQELIKDYQEWYL